MNDNRQNAVTSLEDLQNRLRRKAKFKEIDFQSKCEGENSLGDSLLKNADENKDLRVREFFLRNGFNFPQQEQIAAANEEEKEQSMSEVEENEAESNSTDFSSSRDTQSVALYNSNNVENLYLKINKVVKQKPQASLEELSKELNTKIDFKQKFHNGYVLGDLLLALAIEKSNLDFIKFLFKNELKIINIVSQQEGICHISKTRDGRAVLDHAIYFGNAEVLNLLLQNINAEQSKLKLKSELYELCQQLKNNALDKTIDNEALVTLLISAIEEKQEISNVEEIKPRSGSNGNVISRPVATVPPVSTNGDNHNNEGEMPVVTAPTILTKETNTNQTVTPNSGNGQHHNNENKTPVSTNASPTAIPNNDNKANGFVDAQFSVPNEKEAKYKESKKDFYTSLTKDVVGVVITGLFITAAVMVPFVAGAVVCGIVAALVAVCTGLHIKNSTWPSYGEMEANKIEHVSSGIQKG